MFTIGQVATRMNINASTLRFYDKEGLMPYVDRNDNGLRLFKESDMEWLNMIEYLKATGLTIKEIRQFIDLYMDGDDTIEERRQMFYERKAAIERQLEETQKMLDIVNYKCWFYDQALEDGTTKYISCVCDDDMPKSAQHGRKLLHEWHDKE